jgi:hypothetical protein
MRNPTIALTAWAAGKPGVEEVEDVLAYEADWAAYSGRLGE